MTTPFGTTSTADEVLDGRDLAGKRVLVTGVSAGVGVEIALALAGHSAQVVGAVRDPVRAAVAMGDDKAALPYGHIEFVELDLASLESVRRCADTLQERGDSFDVVIANAGVMATPPGVTVDGFETQFGTNHLGHFAFINGIAPLLGPGGRVVMVSSGAHRAADVDLEDPNFERQAYDPLLAYARSKTANILFAVEFDRRHASRQVRATAIHPGAVFTPSAQRMMADRPGVAATMTWKSPAQGAATSIFAGFVASGDEVGGRYCEDCRVAEIVDDPAIRSGVRSYALDPDRARRLWSRSEEIIRQRLIS